MAKSKPPAVDKNQLVVDQLIALLESGVKPWSRPWKSTKDSRDYQNIFTRKAYSGINPLLCQISNMTHGYESPFFLSFNQARQQGWKIIKGSKATNIRFTKSGTNKVEVEGDNGETSIESKRFFHQNWSVVFSLDCVDDSDSDIKIADILNKPDETPDNPDTPVVAIEQFLAAIGGNIEYGGDKAYKTMNLTPNQVTFNNELSLAFRWEVMFDPTKYSWYTGHESLCAMTVKLQDAVQSGNFTITQTIKTVCKKLKIKPTYKAIKEYLQS